MQIQFLSLLALSAAIVSARSLPLNDSIVTDKKKHGPKDPASGPATVYMIRHGEKPDSGSDLSPAGYKRATCIAKKVFAGKQQFPSPERIIAQGDHSPRSKETVTPLATALNLQIYLQCGQTDIQCVIDWVNSSSTGPVLIAWEHQFLSQIMAGFVDNAPTYPGSEFDLVWEVDVASRTYKQYTQNCK